jgi:hypothetical protein
VDADILADGVTEEDTEIEGVTDGVGSGVEEELGVGDMLPRMQKGGEDG